MIRLAEAAIDPADAGVSSARIRWFNTSSRDGGAICSTTMEQRYSGLSSSNRSTASAIAGPWCNQAVDADDEPSV
jgi:hypothetical protein